MPVTVPLFPWHVDPPYAGRGRRPRAQAAVLAAVRASGDGVTVAALAEATGRSSANVRRCLRALVRASLIERGLGARTPVWRGATAQTQAI
ncbi:MAG: MarR family transcriptional regulator [Myxococcota bacterium]